MSKEDLYAENDRLCSLITELLKVLEYYADPGTYVAVGFFPDSPFGDFIDDFSDDHGDGKLPGPRLGKRARAAIAKAGQCG